MPRTNEPTEVTISQMQAPKNYDPEPGLKAALEHPPKPRCPHCTTELVPHNDSLGALHCDNCDAGCCFTIEGKALVLRPGSRGCLKAVR